jgi:predicted lipid-binding transport protein (Tim44 family)
MSPARRHGLALLARIAAALAVAAASLFVADEAWARVGGGNTFSTGSGGSSGGGRSDGGADLVWLLIRLVIEVPEIGIPLLIIAALCALYLFYQDSKTVRDIHRVVVHHPSGRAGGGGASGWADLLARDPALSRPVLDDFLQLVYRRAYAAVGTKDWPALGPFVNDRARQAIEAPLQGATVDEVVVAAARVDAVQISPADARLTVRFTASRLERRGGSAQRYYVEETWTFRRGADAHSLSPDATTRLGCPSCGAAVRCDPMGRCTHCGTAITAGQLQWQAVEARTEVHRLLDRPPVALTGAGADPSMFQPTVRDPALSVELRKLTARHPDFAPADFDRRARFAFIRLQEAWGAGRWQDARPFCTDTAWNTLRFWVERYAAVGLRNRTADVSVDRLEVVKVQQDAWYEAITVRVWASMRDWMEDAKTGEVVSGNATHAHKFSEYWTFLRATGSGAKSGDPSRCPSCGAPLDQVNAAGECGYCHTVVTTGKFDWVLTRIDQAEVYRG